MTSIQGHGLGELGLLAYDTLPTYSSIRLLQRIGKDAKGTLQFSVRICDLEKEDTKYHCLSYTWGNPHANGVFRQNFFTSADAQYTQQNSLPINVDGQLVYIQKNLYDALDRVPKTAYVDELNLTLGQGGQTYLHYAATKGLADVVERRIRRGAKVDARDDLGKTPLHYAAQRGHVAAAEVLCRAGSLQVAQDDEGKTPLDLAREGGHEDVVSLLEICSEQPDSGPTTIERDDVGADDLIWADAICINQEDIDEKSAQVSIMDWIYSRATFVLAWLGPEDETTKVGLRIVSTLANHMDKFLQSQVVPYGGYDKESYEEADIPLVSWAEWEALANIFQRQWFKRAWIVQEAVLPDVLIMFCGDRKVSWRDLGRVAEAIRRNEAKLGTLRSKVFVPADQIAIPVEWNMAEIYKWRTWMSAALGPDEEQAAEAKKHFTLEELVECFWTFLASNPRDKIFSLNGIQNILGIARLETDYRRSIESVYTGAARQILRECGNINFLSSCIYSAQRLDSLPSWVPDFGLPGKNPIPNLFTADRGLEYIPPRSDITDDPSLKVRGLRLGSISQIQNRPGATPGEKHVFDPSWLKMLLSLKPEEEENAQPVVSEILWRTLCMNMSYGSFYDATSFGPRAPEDFGHQFKIFMMLMILAAGDDAVLKHFDVEVASSFRGAVYIKEPFNPFEEDMASVLEDLDAIEAHDGDKYCLPSRLEVLTLWNSLNYTIHRLTPASEDGSTVDVTLPPDVMNGTAQIVGKGRVETGSGLFESCRSFSTTYNIAFGGRQLFMLGYKHLGLAPLSAKAGDEIWILPGLSAPAVLRRTERSVEEALSQVSLDENAARYHFVGAAYVHGIMGGEAVQGGDVKLEDVELI
ncbi:Fc.00g017800.m01.CDS01 [Cosmosporella sp. VM-42]